MKKIFLLLLATIIFMMESNAQQNEIHGVVVDEKGNGIESALIKVENSEKFSETGLDGKFTIVTDQGSSAVVSHLVYRSQSIVLQNDMTVIMKEVSFDLDNIIVKADPFGNLAQSRIVYDDIKAVTQPRNVSDLFKDIPGFGIQKRGAYASEPVFRAFKYEQLNVQYDGGMKILNACPNRMDPITTHVIPEEIERIEVVKGPFTVRFGQNFGGIVNMVSKNANHRKEGISGNVETGFETNGNNFTGRGAVLYKKDIMDLELNGSYRNYGDYTDGNGVEVPSAFTSTDYSIKLGVNPNEDQRVRLTWRQSFGRDIKHAGLPMDSPYDDSYLIGMDYKIIDISKTIGSFMIKGFYSHVDHLMSNEERPNYAMVEAVSNVFVTTWGGKTEMMLTPSEKSSIYVGLDANFIGREGDRIRKIKVMNGNVLDMPMIKVDKIWQDSELNDIGVFAEGKLRVSDNSTFTAGLRSDFISTSINDPEQDFLDLYGGEIKDQSEVNISGNLSYLFSSQKTQFQVALGRGVRTGSIVERYINHFNINSDPYEYVGNPYLSPEVNNQIELSINQNFDKIDIGANVFYSYLTNYITGVVDESLPRKFMPMLEPRFAKRFINIDRATQAGFEFYFNYNFTEALSFLSDVAYTYGQNETLDEPLPQIIPLTGHLSLNYDKQKYWLNIKSRLVAEQSRISESFGETASPGFTTFDLSGGYKPMTNLSIGASVLNIFNTAYYEHLNFSYRNADILNGRIYEPGRNFTMYVNYSF